MLILASVIILIFGLVIGSFLNVVINRLNLHQNLISPGSHCPNCKHNLNFWDLIPVFSFIFLRGKCRYCQKKISWQYPLVELTTAISFLLLFFKFVDINNINLDFLVILEQLLIYFFFTSILIIIFVYDLKHYLIPNKIIYPALIITLILQIIPISQYPNIPISNLIIGSLIPGIFFLLLVLVSKEKWMGAGDVKLGFLCGLMIGYPNIFVALFISFVLGAIIGIILIISKKKDLKDKMPYGTLLTFATFISILFGTQIINWYFSFLGIV
jgi:prepilin signal peptidase PulO-like enzyme (type II secretory pathway)